MAQVGLANTLGDGTVKRDQVGRFGGGSWKLWLPLLAIGVMLGACGTSRDEDSADTSATTIEADETLAPVSEGSIGQAQTLPLPLQGQTGTSGGLEGPEYYRGTGALARDPNGGQFDPGVGEDGKITLNFANAEIRDVVDIVLGDTLGVNYIIDPGVQGTVTVRTSDPLSRVDVIPALENILALNGVALTLVNGTYMVVPEEVAASGLSTPLVSPNERQLARGFGINIIPLNYASASSMAEILEPFVNPGSLRADSARNILIYSGSGPDARELVDMVKVFDVDWMRGMSFALFPIDTADINKMVEDLEAVFLQEGGSPVQGLIRFVPIERLNAVLVISPRSIYLDRAQTWISRLDRGIEGAGRRIFVYRVENGRAVDLADILNQVFADSITREREVISGGVAPGLTPVELSTPAPAVPAVEGEGGEAAALQESRRGFATPRAGREQTVSRATEGTLGRGTLLEQAGDIRIIADEATNSLLILASAAEFRMIEATLKQLDVLPLQVLIEATIAEVALNDRLTYGLQWFFENGDYSAAFFPFGKPKNPLDLAGRSFAQGFSFLADFSDGHVLLRALTEVTDVKVISSPSLMVLDNQSARLQVGDEVPIRTESSQSADVEVGGNIVSEIQLIDTGVILEVTPRVNTGGLVIMEIVQEVSTAVQTETSDIDSPTIRQRRIESTVAVQSGDTIALGGLIRDDEQESVSGIPLLSDIPILGNLFKTTQEVTLRTELLVLITPRVVHSRMDAQRITEELRERLKSIEPLERKIYQTPQPSS